MPAPFQLGAIVTIDKSTTTASSGQVAVVTDISHGRADNKADISLFADMATAKAVSQELINDRRASLSHFGCLSSSSPETHKATDMGALLPATFGRIRCRSNWLG